MARNVTASVKMIRFSYSNEDIKDEEEEEEKKLQRRGKTICSASAKLSTTRCFALTLPRGRATTH